MPKKITKYFSLPKTLLTSTLIFLIFSLSQMLVLVYFLINENKEINDIILDQNLIESQAYNYINPISIFSSLFGILLIIFLSKYILISPNNSKIKLNQILPILFHLNKLQILPPNIGRPCPRLKSMNSLELPTNQRFDSVVQ